MRPCLPNQLRAGNDPPPFETEQADDQAHPLQDRDGDERDEKWSSSTTTAMWAFPTNGSPSRQPYFWVVFNESRRAKEVKTVEGPFETEAEARQWAHNAFEPCRDY